MKRITRFLAAALVVGVAAGASPALLADKGGEQRFSVTVTNITRGQILSPPLVISHGGDFELFALGEPAGSELAQLAEDAVSGPLIALLGTLPSVFDVNIGAGAILPGDSMTVEIATRGRSRGITVAGMLVTTNDAFFSGSTTMVSRSGGSAFAAIAYDAGSEGNTESCEHIPGPPCDNPLVRVTDSAEGYVHVHAGVHGGADLDPAVHDWRNPVAHVSVRRAD